MNEKHGRWKAWWMLLDGHDPTFLQISLQPKGNKGKVAWLYSDKLQQHWQLSEILWGRGGGDSLTTSLMGTLNFCKVSPKIEYPYFCRQSSLLIALQFVSFNVFSCDTVWVVIRTRTISKIIINLTWRCWLHWVSSWQRMES